MAILAKPKSLAAVGSSPFPGGPPELPRSAPQDRSRRRGRPRKLPLGTWEDDGALADAVSKALSERARYDDGDVDHAGLDVVEKLCRIAQGMIGERFTSKRRRALVSLALARRVKTSVIVRQLLAWAHDLTDPAVRRMQRRLCSQREYVTTSTVLVLRYDEQGRPFCDEAGRPLLWVPGPDGEPSHVHPAGEPVHPRPVKVESKPVKMIYR
jgi:hypothetical protein